MEKKILIVDDEKPIVDVLKFNLEKDGYKTIGNCQFFWWFPIVFWRWRSDKVHVVFHDVIYKRHDLWYFKKASVKMTLNCKTMWKERGWTPSRALCKPCSDKPDLVRTHKSRDDHPRYAIFWIRSWRRARARACTLHSSWSCSKTALQSGTVSLLV